TVLVWRVQGPVPEQRQPELLTLSSHARTNSVASLYRGFRAARSDDSVRGLALYVRDAGFGLAKAQEFRRQIELLSDEGKFVECYFETVGEGTNGTLAYYLASACDHVFLSPVGTVNLLGLYSASPFFRGTLEKLQVEPEFTAEGEYKSAAEQFTRTGYSGPAREALEAVLDGAYRQILEAVAAARDLPLEEVERLVDTAPHTADEALEAGLVDELLYPDEFRDRVEELAGGEPRLVHLDTFGPRARGSHRIAVVVASGTIVRGAGGTEPWTQERFLGSDDLTPIFRDLAESPSIDAVVLRIDSPGGSALASDLILRELQLLAEEKPVIVSMSDLAASGGYYIASRAHRIVAEPATITGSIGVVSGRFATETFQRELLGITYDAVARGENAGIWADPAPLEPNELDEIRALNATIYQTFLEHVATGREMSLDQVEEVARGRVWIGADAHRLGLVDELGGLDRAVELAAEAAGLPEGEPRQLVYFPEPKGWLELLLDERRPLLPATVRTLLEGLAPPVRGALHAPPEVRALARPF
ncbi:MAG: signal peptide peptidase SppA, partial [Gemmatimonadota bacterium]